MGRSWIGDLLDLWHHESHHRRIRNLEGETDRASRAKSRMRRRSGELERERDQLELMAMALQEMLEAYGPIDPQVLADKILEIDLRDGRADGRLGGKNDLAVCPRCRRVLSKTFQRCLYCPSDEA